MPGNGLKGDRCDLSQVSLKKEVFIWGSTAGQGGEVLREMIPCQWSKCFMQEGNRLLRENTAQGGGVSFCIREFGASGPHNKVGE